MQNFVSGYSLTDSSYLSQSPYLFLLWIFCEARSKWGKWVEMLLVVALVLAVV
jgi:hypothetical protein